MKRLIASAILLIGLAGCNEKENLHALTKASNVETNPDFNPNVVPLRSGQLVASVEREEFNSWLVGHPDVRINTITSVNCDENGGNKTSGFIIVFEKTK